MLLTRSLWVASVLASCAVTQPQVSWTTTPPTHEMEPIATSETRSTAWIAYPDSDARAVVEQTLHGGQKPTAFVLITKGLSCWLVGGDQRCGELAGFLYGDVETAMRSYRNLRAANPIALQAFEDEVRERAGLEGWSRRTALTNLARSVAYAGNEHISMRNALAKAGGIDGESYKPFLQNHTELTALLTTEPGPLAPSAYAIGLLFTMDRLEAVGDGSPDLQVLVLGGPLDDLFHVGAPPAVPGWELERYMLNVAQAAGHPVTTRSTSDENIRRAHKGILCGIGDRMRAVAPSVEPPLDDAVRGAASEHTCE